MKPLDTLPPVDVPVQIDWCDLGCSLKCACGRMVLLIDNRPLTCRCGRVYIVELPHCARMTAPRVR